MCDYASFQLSHLRSHLIRDTGEKPNECNQCNYDKMSNKKSWQNVWYPSTISMTIITKPQLHHIADLLGDVGHFQVYLLLQHHLSGHYYHQLWPCSCTTLSTSLMTQDASQSTCSSTIIPLVTSSVTLSAYSPTSTHLNFSKNCGHHVGVLVYPHFGHHVHLHVGHHVHLHVGHNVGHHNVCIFQFFKMVWQMIQKIVWQMIQIWGGKRYKKEVANDTKYGVADDWMADETQPDFQL